jgi:hypothetical protein
MESGTFFELWLIRLIKSIMSLGRKEEGKEGVLKMNRFEPVS